MKNFNQTKAGYTIIETMISISVFLVVIMIGMDTLLNANVVHQKSQDMSSIIDSLSFTMEDMARNIRVGSYYRCIAVAGDLDSSVIGMPKTGNNCFGIAFEASTPAGNPLVSTDQWVYYIATGKLYKSTDGGANFTQLTLDNTVVGSSPSIAGFLILGAEQPPDKQQPIVTIRLSGNITYKNVVSPFSLQTSVSQRLVDR